MGDGAVKMGQDYTERMSELSEEEMKAIEISKELREIMKSRYPSLKGSVDNSSTKTIFSAACGGSGNNTRNNAVIRKTETITGIILFCRSMNYLPFINYKKLLIKT